MKTYIFDFWNELKLFELLIQVKVSLFYILTKILLQFLEGCFTIMIYCVSMKMRTLSKQ